MQLLAAVEEAVRLQLPPRESLLPLAEDALRRLSRHHGLTTVLEDMLVGAALEACEELLRAGRAANLERPFELVLDFDAQAAEVALVYDSRIPLNPHLTEPYEVPAASAAPEGINLDTLWLHLIKHRMDRVFFEVKGPESLLRLVKHRRDEGEEKRLWFLGMAPALRPGLNLQYSGPERAPGAVLIQDFDSGKVFRFGPLEALAIRLMDGQRTLYDIYLALVEESGAISPHRLGLLYEALESAGMLAVPEGPAGAARPRPWRQRLLNPVFSIPRADAVVETVHRWLRPLVSPAGFFLLLAIGLSGAVPLGGIISRLDATGLPDLERLIRQHPASVLVVYVLQMLAVAGHELAHGLTCKHFGGRVPRLGLMLYLASFIFFCDTTAAWNFTSRRQRILVSLAGPLVTFACLGGCLWAAGHFLGTGSFWEPVCLMSGLLLALALVMNFNPFIRMDAYYMLLDLTGIGNLREKSFRFLGSQILGRWRTNRPEAMDLAGNRPWIFWLYGLLGGIVTLALFLLPFIYLVRLVLREGFHGAWMILGLTALALTLFGLSHKAMTRLRLLRHREYKLK